MKGRYARFSALALKASDIGIGSGITSIIRSVRIVRAEWRRLDRLREKIKHLMVQAPQSIRMIHFRFFIIAFVVWVVRGGYGGRTYLLRTRIPPNELLRSLIISSFRVVGRVSLPISLYVTNLRLSNLAFVHPSSMKCLMKYSLSSQLPCDPGTKTSLP